MTRENAIYYLQSSGFSEEQISEIEQGFKDEPCDKYIKEIDHLRKYIYKLETKIVEQEHCEDAISRQAAIGIIQNWLDYNIGYSCGEKIVMLCTIGELKDLPSVSAEKTGRWIPDKHPLASPRCSICNGYGYRTDAYCKTCGAKMGGVEE